MHANETPKLWFIEARLQFHKAYWAHCDSEEVNRLIAEADNAITHKLVTFASWMIRRLDALKRFCDRLNRWIEFRHTRSDMTPLRRLLVHRNDYALVMILFPGLRYRNLPIVFL